MADRVQALQLARQGGRRRRKRRSRGRAGLPVISKDGKTYTFTVKPGFKFSNGKAVTAQSFVDAFERFANPKMGESTRRVGGVPSWRRAGAQASYDGKAQQDLRRRGEGQQAHRQADASRARLHLARSTMPFIQAIDPTLAGQLRRNDVSDGRRAARTTSRLGRRTARHPRAEQELQGQPRRPTRTGSGRRSATTQNQRSCRSRTARPTRADRAVPATGGRTRQRVRRQQEAASRAGSRSVDVRYCALNTSRASPSRTPEAREGRSTGQSTQACAGRVSGKFGGRRTTQILPPAMPGYQQAATSTPQRRERRQGEGGRRGREQRADAARHLCTRTAANINRGADHAVQPEAMGLKAKTEPIPSAQLFTRAGDKKNGNYDSWRSAWGADYADPYELHQHPPGRAQHPRPGLEQQLRAVQQPEVQQADGRGREALAVTRASPRTASSTSRS